MAGASPLRFLLAFFAGIVDRQQSRTADYLVDRVRTPPESSKPGATGALGARARGRTPDPGTFAR
jgi:hypothetical protein